MNTENPPDPSSVKASVFRQHSLVPNWLLIGLIAGGFVLLSVMWTVILLLYPQETVGYHYPLYSSDLQLEDNLYHLSFVLIVAEPALGLLIGWRLINRKPVWGRGLIIGSLIMVLLLAVYYLLATTLLRGL